MEQTEHDWVIVASIAEGDRARAYWDGERRTHTAAGRSALARAVAQARSSTAEERIVPVVLDEHRPWWRALLAGVPEENIVVEPFDRGTAPGILLAVVRILKRDPKAVITIVPADPEAGGDDAIVSSVQRMIGLFQHAQPKLLHTCMTELRGPAVFSDEALSSLYPYLPDVAFTSDVLYSGSGVSSASA